MVKFLVFGLLFLSLTSCWPERIAFKDGSMPEEWKSFTVLTLDNNASNTPLSYALDLSEEIRSGIQNNTRLQLASNTDSAQVNIEGVISAYSITPVALQEGDNAAKNRLTVSANFTIFVTAPEEDELTLTCSRFVDYDAATDLGVVESDLLSEVSLQIVQDVINKLLSNW